MAPNRLAEHRLQIVLALARLVENVGENPVRQQLDVLGEEAKKPAC